MTRETPIAEPITLGKHDDLVIWLNRLIIDLKLELLGQRKGKITMARLDEGTQLIQHLNLCRKQTRKFRGNSYE